VAKERTSYRHSKSFKVLVNGVREEVHESVAETLSNIILICYMLGRRLGVSYNSIEIKINNK